MKSTYPFNSQNGDRKYNADDIAAERAVYFSNGVIVYGGNTLSTELKVVAVSGMTVKVNFGMANINGRTIKIVAPDVGETNITLAAADLTNPRIDRIVLELNLTDSVRDIVIKAVKGTPAASPAAPNLTRTDTIWQLSLAKITVPANSASIGAITDERADSTLCGISNVQVGIKPPTGNDAVTVALSPETKNLYSTDKPIMDVDAALQRALIDFSSYQAFCAGVNANSLDAAFGKNNADRIKGIGLQLAMYAWFKGESKTTYPYTEIRKIDKIEEINTTWARYLEYKGSANIQSLIAASPYAITVAPCKYAGEVKYLLYKPRGFANGMGNLSVTSYLQIVDGLTTDGFGVKFSGSLPQNTVLGTYTSPAFSIPSDASLLVLQDLRSQATKSAAGGDQRMYCVFRIFDSDGTEKFLDNLNLFFSSTDTSLSSYRPTIDIDVSSWNKNKTYVLKAADSNLYWGNPSASLTAFSFTIGKMFFM